MSDEKPHPKFVEYGEVSPPPFIVGRVDSAPLVDVIAWATHPYIGSGGLMDEVVRRLIRELQECGALIGEAANKIESLSFVAEHEGFWDADDQAFLDKLRECDTPTTKV